MSRCRIASRSKLAADDLREDAVGTRRPERPAGPRCDGECSSFTGVRGEDGPKGAKLNSTSPSRGDIIAGSEVLIASPGDRDGGESTRGEDVMYVPYLPVTWLEDGDDPLCFDENSERDEDALPESGSRVVGYEPVLGVRKTSRFKSTMLADFKGSGVFRERCIAGGGIRCFVLDRLRPDGLEVPSVALFCCFAWE